MAFKMNRVVTAALLGCLAISQALAQDEEHKAGLKRTYIPLTSSGHGQLESNGVLVEPVQPSPKERIVAINTHPKNRNNFEYFIGDQLASRGYRVIEVNDYGPETSPEALLPGIAAAVKYARGLPGVQHVVLVGHSGGGPVLSFYQEIAEKGPAACQQPNRLYPCDPRNLGGLPKADALLELEANIGAPHRNISLDPAVDSAAPNVRNPALDMYAPQNGFDPKTNTANYSPDFIKRYQAAQHARGDAVVNDALAKLAAIKNHTGPYKDDEPFVVPGMSENASGARLNLADPNILSQSHGEHMMLMADGSPKTGIIHLVRKPGAIPERQRDTLGETTQSTTVRGFLSWIALRTTPDFALTKDSMKGIDWRSSANSIPGNVENVTVPTLVMAGSCMIHLVPLEESYDHSAAKDKQFVAVEGGDHYFRPCRPEYGDTEKRAFDFVDAWLTKRF